MGRPIIVACTCGRVKKFGEWVRPPQSLTAAISAGTYQKQMEKCTTCASHVGSSNRLIPVKEK